MVCEVCGSASERETFCPGCGVELSTISDRPAFGPSHDTLPVVDTSAPRCPRHPDMGANATCKRCGRFVCSRCDRSTLWRTQLTCPECVALEERSDQPRRSHTLRLQLMGSWLAVAGLLTIMALRLGISLARDSATQVGLALLISPAVLSLLILTLLFALTKHRLFGWMATLIESAVLMPLLFAHPSWWTAVLASAPVFGVVRLVQLKELALAMRAAS